MSRHCWFGLHITALLALLAPAGAQAQAIDWIASEEGITILRGPGSARLEGMGGLAIAVPDEWNKLDLNHYGGNISALLWSSDSRKWDMWGRTGSILHDQFDVAGNRNRVRLDSEEYGGRVAWWSGKKRVLGLDYVYDLIDHDAPFDVSKVRGPWGGAFGGQKVGRAVIGGGIHISADSQDLSSSDFFAIRHRSSGQRFVGSIAFDAGSLDLGLQAERQVNNISGISRDIARFHEDTYTWKRPIEVYGGSAIWSVNDAVRGAVRARAMRIDGRQDVRISWSDRMPENPGRINFVIRAGTFNERVRTFETGTRWEMRPAGSVQLAVEGSFLRTNTEVAEGYNFKGSRRAEDSKERVARAGGGLSYQTPSRRIRLGAEGWFLRDSREDALTQSKIVARTYELRSGAECFVNDVIAVRAGYIRSAEDQDTDLPRTLGIGNGFSVGAGYLPRGGLYQVDTAIRVEKVLPDYDGNPRSEERRTYFSLTIRFLI